MSRRLRRMKRKDPVRWYRVRSQLLRAQVLGALQEGVRLTDVMDIVDATIDDWETVVYLEKGIIPNGS